MLVTFLKRLSDKDLKTVKTLKIQQGCAKIWRFKIREKTIFSNKMADFSDFQAPYICTALAFGAKVGTLCSCQNVTKSKNKNDRIFRNVKFYLVRKFRDIPN
jgi:hypothetical protein